MLIIFILEMKHISSLYRLYTLRGIYFKMLRFRAWNDGGSRAKGECSLV